MKIFIISFLMINSTVGYAQILINKTDIRRPISTTVQTTAQTTGSIQGTAPDPAIIASYNWWKYVNPTNVNNLSAFSYVNPVNYDTGIVAYSKRTAIGLAG